MVNPKMNRPTDNPVRSKAAWDNSQNLLRTTATRNEVTHPKTKPAPRMSATEGRNSVTFRMNMPMKIPQPPQEFHLSKKLRI